MSGGLVPLPVPPPRLPQGVSRVLTETARAASDALAQSWAQFERSELAEIVRVGADGTDTFRLDDAVEAAIIETAGAHGVNVLSEEHGFIDGGHAATLVIDPLDGSANAVAGVPLSCFSAALYVDGRAVEALNLWLENGWTQWARRDGEGLRTAGGAAPVLASGARSLRTAAVDLLRPKRHADGDSTAAWIRVSEACARVRVLSTTCLESMLVASGAIDAFADPGSQTHRLVDLAAASLIVPAAGGAVIDAFGAPLEFDTDLTRRWSGVIAATEELAEELAVVIRG
ncbi:inositol monophosphatase family protein [Brevibacterium album]|uniref:inositol monophosphatase family protein n=1 Tax=Brevibacterium album TaxID=417948 RepID=UPI00040ED41F|nr:inositol monophosphatase family protein [Brevibacterium album]